MNGNAHHDDDDDDDDGPSIELPPRRSIIVGFVGLAIIVAIVAVALLLTGGVLVWVTGLVETWLEFPSMSMLIAVIGISVIVVMRFGQNEIIANIHEIQWNPLEALRDHMEMGLEDEEEEEDDEDEVLPARRAGRRR